MNGPYRHFCVLPDGRTKLFNVTKCEKCGCEVEDVNAIGGVARDVPKYLDLGMTARPELCEDLVWSDELGMAVCEGCYSTALNVKDKKEGNPTVEDVIIDFLRKEGIEGFVKILEEVKKQPIDPFFDYLCEKTGEYEREKAKEGEKDGHGIQ